MRNAETIPGTLQWPDEPNDATQDSHPRNMALAALSDAERGSLYAARDLGDPAAEPQV